MSTADIPSGVPRTRRWLIGILGGSEERGRWRLASRLRIVALLGGVKLDLGSADVEAPESLITAVAVLGGVEIVAPPDMPIQLSGLAFFGGKSDERGPGSPAPGAPLVRIRVFALFGGVKVSEREA